MSNREFKIFDSDALKNIHKRVFFSISDPDKRSYNKAFKLLRNKGIKVNISLLKKKILNFQR